MIWSTAISEVSRKPNEMQNDQKEPNADSQLIVLRQSLKMTVMDSMKQKKTTTI